MPSPVVFPRENNPFWPLPADYQTLTTQGRRLARLNACCMQSDPDLAVHAWDFFCDYYLKPDPETGWNPMWYQRYLPPAPIHYHMIRWFESYDQVGIGAPRSSAKSTTTRSYCLWKVLTNPQFDVNLFVSKHNPFIPRAFDAFKIQIAHNQRIVDDFGELKPSRGDGLWSSDAIRLRNYSSLCGFSMEGRKRGQRGSFNVCDDVEQDPKESTNSEQKIAELKKTILQVIVPMLDEGCRMAVVGTLLHRRSFLNNVLRHLPTDDLDYDERFSDKYWFKIIIPAVDTEGRNAWPEKYTPEYLQRKRNAMGYSLFSAEYLNEPVSAEDRILDIQPVKHEYSLENQDDAALDTPFKSNAIVHWHEAATKDSEDSFKPRVMPWSEFLESKIRLRFVTVDFARETKPESDLSAVHVIGQDDRDDLWSLDLWSGKVRYAELENIIWRMAYKWKAHFVAPEDVALQDALCEAVARARDKYAKAYGWAPQVRPFKVPHDKSKGQRIQRLEWRFNRGKIKFPGFRTLERPYANLYRQIRDFTEDLANLPHDDELDTLGMSSYLLKGGRPGGLDYHSPETPLDMIKAGESFIPGTDISLGSFIDIRQLDPRTVEEIISMRRQEHMEALETDYRRVNDPEFEWDIDPDEEYEEEDYS